VQVLRETFRTFAGHERRRALLSAVQGNGKKAYERGNASFVGSRRFGARVPRHGRRVRRFAARRRYLRRREMLRDVNAGPAPQEFA